MILAFTLSMPSNNSWNGRWSGENKLYVITKTFSGKIAIAKAIELVKVGRFSYNFGDGWRAAINVTQVDSKQAARLRKQSSGFCGYEWMTKSIIKYGVILADHQIEDFEKANLINQ